ALETDCAREQGAQLSHFGAAKVGQELGPGGPGAWSVEDPPGDGRALLCQVRGKTGKGLLERPSHALRVPDKVPDAQGCKLLARVPGGQARPPAAAFVLPDPPADDVQIPVGERRGPVGTRGADQDD